jgi:myo-inositol-1-phosphate synthase
MRKIRIAVVGVGNCASSLIQGINFYHSSVGDGTGVGLMHPPVQMTDDEAYRCVEQFIRGERDR